MSKIRKQPRRSTKKVCQPIVRNIFGEGDQYHKILPRGILSKLKIVEEICINNLEQFISQPHGDQLDSNLALMRQAFNNQRTKISGLPIHEEFQRIQQLQTQQQIRQDTKKTAHSVHEFQAAQLMMLNSEDDNIFFQEFGQERRGPSRTHEDFMAMEGELGVNEDIDILSMIN